MTGSTLAAVGEFGLIQRVRDRLGPTAPTTILGPGDDAAVVAAPDGRVVVTTDLLVEGRHFRLDWSSAYDVGRKAAAANLADLAAMGARPTALLVGLAAPSRLPVATAEALTDGLHDESARCGAAVVGGDVVRAETLMLAVTALGDLGGAPPVTRSGARPRDLLVVLGQLGGAAAGLGLLERGDHALLERHPSAVAAYRCPTPPYADALLARQAGSTAMIDVSDGFAADLGHLLTASGVGAEVDTAALPRHPGVDPAAAELGLDPVQLALTGGEDHAFVVAVPEASLGRLHELLGGPAPAAVVGRVTAAAGVRWLGGEPAAGWGFDHFEGGLMAAPARVLTIAGSDSGGGAGIQADLKTMLALGVHGMSALTAVTAQNSLGVQGWWALPVEAVRAQIRSVVDDIGVDAVKLGMLGAASVVEAVAEEIRGVGVPVVVDPVCASKHGDPLLEPDAVAALRELIVPLATVVTPNLGEVTVLTGVEVRDVSGLSEAARAVHALGPRWTLVKGGHLAGEAVDLLWDGAEGREYAAARADNRHTHGTGCTLASAIASHLALGADVPDAVARAKDYVTAAIGAGFALGTGIGPVDHAWLWRGAPIESDETDVRSNR